MPKAEHAKINPRHRRYRQRTRCSRGHKYTPENTYLSPRGARYCRTCSRERVRRHYDRHLRKTEVFNHPRRSEPGGPTDHRDPEGGYSVTR